MLARISLTPSVMTVRRGIGSAVLMRSSAIRTSLEQAELLPAALRPGEMIRGQFRTTLVEPQLFAGDLEAAADHPGHWTCPLHPRSPLRVVVASIPHVTDQGENVTIAIGIVSHQPFAKD